MNPAEESCLACGQKMEGTWLSGCPDLYLQTPVVVDYRECGQCRMVQQSPVPRDTSAFYPSDYPMHHSRGRLYQIGRRLLIRGVYFEPTSRDGSGSLMDFGCGDGSYLDSIRGKMARLVGVESSPDQAAQIREHLGFEVFSDLAEAEQSLSGEMDVVTAHFVLEHLTDLQSAFRFWARVLKPGGLLHIAVPNIRCIEAKLFGRKWHGLDAPRHINFVADDSMDTLAAQFGFVVESRRYGHFPNTWAASLATVLAGRFRNPLFLLCLPLGVLLSWMLPHSTKVYTLRKNTVRSKDGS